MIDIHSHILHDIDDGPKTIENSIALVKESYELGISKFVSTSHYYSDNVLLDDFVSCRDKRIRVLRDELAVRKIGVEVLRGAEVYLTPVLLNLDDVSALCFEGTNYMLLEIPHGERNFDDAYTLIERISSYFNVKPIIAHIERYRFLSLNRENLGRLRELGCLFQVDAGALFTGMLNKRHVLKLIADGMVDFVASDCHGDARRQNLDDAYGVIEKKLGKDVSDRLKNNARLVLENVSANVIMP